MKQTRLLMGMPITIEVVDASAVADAFDRAYAFLAYVDATFSPFKETSEVSRINRGELALDDACDDMQTILRLAEQTRQETDGYFDVWHDGTFNPSGVVKGWAILQSAEILRNAGYRNFYVDAGGDVQAVGHNANGEKWRVGIRNPFDPNGIVKRVAISNCGIATSGLYNRGAHIYDPISAENSPNTVASITIIAPNVLDADRIATPTFAMGSDGIHFIESLVGYEAYMIENDGMAIMTSGFTEYV